MRAQAATRRFADSGRSSHLQGCRAVCEALESRQLLSTDIAAAAQAAATPAMPQVSITVDRNAKEALLADKGNGYFLIKRTGSTKNPLEVHYALTNSGTGVAVLGVDYTTPAVDPTTLIGVATIPAHKSSLKIPVHAFLDTTVEGRETVPVTLVDEETYDVNAKHAAATMSIQNRFAIDAESAFGDVTRAYTATMRTTYKEVPQHKSIVTADATFPLDLAGFGSTGGAAVTMTATPTDTTSPWQADGLHLRTITLSRQGSWTERSVEMKDIVYLPTLVGPSFTQAISSQFGVFASQDTVPGTVQVNSKATANVKVKTAQGTFTATKLVVKTNLLAKGKATVTARLRRNGPEITRRVQVSRNDAVTWTYFLVPGMGVVKAVASGTFKQTTQPMVTFKVTYVLPAPATTPTTGPAPAAA